MLLYPVEASQQLRTMFPDGTLQPLEVTATPLHSISDLEPVARVYYS